MDNPYYRTARLLEIQPETEDTSSYVFALEDGQSFRYSPGQFNMLGLPGTEEAAISFSSLATADSSRFTHTIRRLGNVTNLIGKLNVGQRLMMRGPFGNGWPIEKAVGCDVLLVTGGLGLAPIRPLLLHCLEKRNQIRNLVLIHGARTPDDMIFQKNLTLWQDQDKLTTIYCVDQLTRKSPLDLRVGLVTQFMEGLDLDLRTTLACVCGPEIMMRFVARTLLLQGYREDRIYVSMERRMRCGTGHCGHCQIGPKFVCQDGPIFSYPDISRFPDTTL
ncbi:MAG: FAD/NAD(P)-binding protein [bacterium]